MSHSASLIPKAYEKNTSNWQISPLNFTIFCKILTAGTMLRFSWYVPITVNSSNVQHSQKYHRPTQLQVLLAPVIKDQKFRSLIHTVLLMD